MAGIGVRLNQIFEKNTLISDLIGFGYSTIVTVAPMFLVIGNIVLMGQALELSKVAYAPRELMSCTILYMFIFSMLTTAPFNSVLSKYMSDVIFEEKYEDILPCFYLGLFLNVVVSSLLGIPFCIHEVLVGKIGVLYAFTGFCGYMACVLVFYVIKYLQICKDYMKITVFFLVGMASAFVMSLVLVYLCSFPVTDSMLVSITMGFLVIACEEIAMVKRYFKKNSGRYRPVFAYMKKYWMLFLTDAFYTAGLYIHNFVFWTTDIKMVVAKSFVCAPAYDMATCLAMFTNISSTIILISRLEMHFREKYKGYSEAVIGGRAVDIRNAQKRMFRQLAAELMNLVRIQFIISICVFLIIVVILPQYGFSGLVMQIYPCLAAGFFILFLMYAAIIFLYYYNDLVGAMLTALFFVLGILGVSVYAAGLSESWYGIGVVAGSLLGWCVAYLRLRWVERHLDEHIFCTGILIKYARGRKLPSKVYDIREARKEERAVNEE
ncbi:MAG: exopolysaccharide Pel transporter PelG [Lachnospiraceae bacterium]|nr:exopolysaccharide Pel transporter PelG [Lachnospiraceae bacterium]